MSSLKKKDLDGFTLQNKSIIKEFVNPDGTFISGDRNKVNDTEIETAPQQTTDDFIQATGQNNNYYTGTGQTSTSRKAIGEDVDLELELNEDISNSITGRKLDELVKAIDKNNVSDKDVAKLAIDFINRIKGRLSQQYINNIKRSLNG